MSLAKEQRSTIVKPGRFTERPRPSVAFKTALESSLLLPAFASTFFRQRSHAPSFALFPNRHSRAVEARFPRRFSVFGKFITPRLLDEDLEARAEA